MEQIEKSSLGLLISSVLVILLVLSIYALDRYLETPPLFIEPQSNKSRTMLNAVLEAENIEGLKKICSLWATQEDRTRQALDGLIEKTAEIRKDGFILALFISAIFIVGAGRLHFQVKKHLKASQDAL